MFIGFGGRNCDYVNPDSVDLTIIHIDPNEDRHTGLAPNINHLLRDGDSVHFLDTERKTAFFTLHRRVSINNTTTIEERVHFATLSYDCIILLSATAYTITHTKGEASELKDDHYERNLNLLIQVMRSIRRNGIPVWNGKPDVKLLRRKLYLDVSFNDYIDYALNQKKPCMTTFPNLLREIQSISIVTVSRST